MYFAELKGMKKEEADEAIKNWAKKNNNSRGSSRGFISYSMVVDGAAHLQVI